jgi:hypothetical protein
MLGLTDRTEPAPGVTAEPEPPHEAEPPEIHKDKRAKSAWEFQKKEIKSLKDQLAQAELKRKEIQQALETARGEKTTHEQELETRNQFLENEVGRYDLAATRAFQERHDVQIANVRRRAVMALEKAGRAPDAAQQLIDRMTLASADPADLESYIDELPRWVQGVVSASVFEIREREGARQQELSDWRQTRAALEAEATRSNEQLQRRAVVQDTVGAVTELAEKHGSWVFRSDPNNSEWEQQRERLVLEAQHVLTQDNETLARFVLQGVAADYYRRWGESLLRANKQLQQALQARDASAPKINGGGGSITPPPPPPPADTKKPISLEEGLRAAMSARKQ